MRDMPQHPILAIREKQIKEIAVKQAEKNLKEKYKPTTGHLLLAGMTIIGVLAIFNSYLAIISGFFCACFIAETFMNYKKATQVHISGKSAEKPSDQGQAPPEHAIYDVDDTATKKQDDSWEEIDE